MVLLSDNEDLARSRRRAAHAELREHLDKLGVESQTARLPFGDVSFTGNGPDGSTLSIGIELKTILDFVGSMRSNRLLAHQIPGMKEMYDRQYIIIEGIYRTSRRNGLLEIPTGKAWRSPNLGPQPVYGASIAAFIVGLSESGVVVLGSRTPSETAHTIRTLYQWWNKNYEEHSTLRPALKQGPEPILGSKRPNQKWRLAATLPGVGWNRGKAIAEKFQSNKEMALAEQAEWETIEGVGKTIARRIYEFWNEESEGAIDDGIHRTQTSQLPAGTRSTRKNVPRDRGHDHHRSRRTKADRSRS